MTEKFTRPADFDAYWEEVDRDLARFDPAPELAHSPRRSFDRATAYDLRLTSLGPARIFGYYSVPRGDGPFPALLQTPRYGSVNNPPHADDRERYVVLTLMHRGQRLADQPYAAAYPGLLTDGIADPRRYLYRGIVADCLRGAEWLVAQPEVDPARVAVVGDDLALLTAARRPVFAALIAANLLFHRLWEARSRTDAYPIEEINDALRAAPADADRIAQTLAYFDPRHHATRITAHALLPTGADGTLSGADWLAPLSSSFAGPVVYYPLTNEGGTDHDWLDAWLAARIGAPAAPRLWDAAR